MEKEMEKINAVKSDISAMLAEIQRNDLNSTAKVTYYKDLAKLHYYLCKIGDEMEGRSGYAMRGSMASYYPGDDSGNMSMDYAMRRGRAANGQYISRSPGAGYAFDSYTMGVEPKETLRGLMADPSLSFEARECLRKAMENMR